MAMAMIELINALTGTRMFVTPAREAEYLAAGHTRVTDRPAAQPGGDAPAEEPATATAKEQVPADKTAAKRSSAAKK